MTTVGVSFEADTRGLTRPVEKLKGVAAGVAGKVERELDGAFVKVARSAESAGAKVQRSADKMGRSFTKAAATVDQAGKMMGAGLAAAAAAGAGLVTLGQEIADTRNELSDMSVETGISVETLAALRFGANAAGKDLSGFQSSLGKFADTAAKAAEGVGPAADVFEGLGVSATDTEGKLRPLDGLFREVAQKIASIEDETLRTAAATRVFGRSGGGLTNVMQVLGGDLDRVAAATEVVGTGMELGANEAAQYQRDMAVLNQVLDRVKASAAGTAGAFVKGLAGGMQLTRMAAITATGGLTAMAAQLSYLTSSLSSGTIPTLEDMNRLAEISGKRIVESLRDETEAFRTLLGSTQEAIDEKVDLDKLNDKLTGSSDGVTTAAEREKAAREAAAAAAKAHAAEVRKLAIDVKHSSEAVKTLEEELLEEASAEREAQIAAGELAAAHAEIVVRSREANAETALLVQQMREAPEATLSFRDAMAVAAEAVSRGARIVSGFADAAGEAFAASQAAAEEYAEKQVAAIERIERSNRRLRKARQTASTEERAQINASIAANNMAIQAREQGLKRADKKARAAFRASQANQVAAAVAATGAAFAAAFAPPPLGAGPIAGAFLAAANTVALGAKIDQIRRQKYTPAFADGGLVGARVQSIPQDHVPILADPREGIVSPRGMANLGEDGLAAINRGEAGGGGDVHLSAQLVLDRRVVGEVFASITGSGSRRTGRLPVHV